MNSPQPAAGGFIAEPVFCSANCMYRTLKKYVMTAFKKKIIIVLVYGAGVLLFFEGAARLFLSSDVILDKIKGEDAATRRIIWIREHQGKTPNLQAFDIYDSRRGWALRPDIRNGVLPGGQILNSNTRGIRGKDEYRYGKPYNIMRILVLGDSFTFGEEVSDDQTFPAYLQQMLPHSEVINFGVHGYGHDQMLLYLQEEGVKYAPDIVILGFIYGDMRRNLTSFRDYAKPEFGLIKKELKLTHAPVPSPGSFLEGEIYRSKFYDLLTILYYRLMLHSGKEQERMEEITTAIFDEMIKTIKDIGAVPVFVYLPYNEEMDNTGEKITDREGFLFRYCKPRNIDCLSVRPYFSASASRGVIFRKSGHWDARGNLIAAEGIREYLANNVIKTGR
jgi:hypothetical protein